MTLAGRCHARNVGVSLLAACGLSAGWVAASEDEYVQLAVDAAYDIPVSYHWLNGMQHLLCWRCGFDAQHMCSLLCSAADFRRNF